MKIDVPAVSIVIPMYNAEKYIGECLDSILLQTFSDYEVIVVDDCSTDKSCKVVESYLPKLEGKLKLIRSEKNSDHHIGLQRNKGLRNARGKYVYFMDNDDAIVENALEMLFNIAEKFNADVVHSDHRYILPINNFQEIFNKCSTHSKDIAAKIQNSKDFSIDFIERLQGYITKQLKWEPWNHFIKREFLTKNNLEFPMLRVADDLLFTLYIICAAENFVVTPNSFYIWRAHPDSTSRHSNPPEKTLRVWGHDLFMGIQKADEFMQKYNFFKENPIYRYAVFGNFRSPNYVLNLYADNSIETLDALTQKVLEETGTNNELTSVLFNRMNVFNLQVLQLQQIVAKKDAKIKDLERQLSEAYNVFSQ